MEDALAMDKAAPGLLPCPALVRAVGLSQPVPRVAAPSLETESRKSVRGLASSFVCFFLFSFDTWCFLLARCKSDVNAI